MHLQRRSDARNRLFRLTPLYEHSIISSLPLKTFLFRAEASMADKNPMTVKHWPEDERPRERLIAHGPASLSDAQLLAIIIRNGKSGRTALDLGRELLERFEGLSGIDQAGIKEICAVAGIGQAKAAEIKAAIELGRRYQKPSLAGASFCSTPDGALYYPPRMEVVKQEEFGRE